MLEKNIRHDSLQILKIFKKSNIFQTIYFCNNIFFTISQFKYQLLFRKSNILYFLILFKRSKIIISLRTEIDSFRIHRLILLILNQALAICSTNRDVYTWNSHFTEDRRSRHFMSRIFWNVPTAHKPRRLLFFTTFRGRSGKPSIKSTDNQALRVNSLFYRPVSILCYINVIKMDKIFYRELHIYIYIFLKLFLSFFKLIFVDS